MLYIKRGCCLLSAPTSYTLFAFYYIFESLTRLNLKFLYSLIRILDVSNETPGLGQNTANKSFTSQFKGKSFGITVVKGSADSKKNEINAVTGATISSKAVTKAVNKAIDIITNEQDGGKNEE